MAFQVSNTHAFELRKICRNRNLIGKVCNCSFEIIIVTAHVQGLLLNITDAGPQCLRNRFQVVKTQTTTAYCRILLTLDQHV